LLKATKGLSSDCTMVALTYLLFFSFAVSSVEASTAQENPIRKIVTLLQNMVSEIEAEGEKEEKAYDKFMCYCNGNTDSMKASAAEGAQKAEELGSKLEALKAQKAQLTQELSDHQNARETAKQDAKKAQNIRDKENAEYVDAEADMSTNIAAMKGAVEKLSAGMGSFMQMGAGQMARVQKVIDSSNQVDEYQRGQLTDLLQGKESMGSTGEILGMLKAMQEEMEGDLKAANDAEATAAAGFTELSAAKASEIAASTSAIESKTKRAGEVAVEVVQTSNDQKDTEEEVADTQTFLADLGTQCASKKGEWAERQKMRAQEVAAVGEAIKVLNDDSALDLFKKTESLVQTGGMAFLQKTDKSSKVLRARNLFTSLAQVSKSHSTQMSLIASALKAKAVDFTKIAEMIDGMVVVLAKEQVDDDEQKEFCSAEFAKSAQTKKDTESKMDSLAASLEEMSATVENLASEISTLQAEIKSLDSAVAQATEQRKSENAAFTQAQAENQAAVEILGVAKNKLNKFYRPNQYKAPERRELTEEEKMVLSSGGADPRDAEEAAAAAQANLPSFVQVRMATNSKAAPPPPPETFGAYESKGEKSGGVMGLMDMMTSDLKDDHTEAKHAEEMAQKDYENLMSASQKSRAANAKSITEKESAKAEWSEKIENAKTDHALTTDGLMKLNEYISGLHASCDFLIESYDQRKEARTNESEGLKNAKAVLSGANMGF